MPSKPVTFPLYTAQTSRTFQLVDEYPEWTTSLVAVDPGGEHVGVAAFGGRPGVVDEEGDGPLAWECVWAGEMTPLEFEDWLSEQMIHGRIDILIYETWKLFPDKAMQQTGSDMPTSQLIGVIKYIHRACKMTNRWPGLPVEIHHQDPDIKVPIRSVLKNRKIMSMAKFLRIPLDHAADAELHGYYHIIRTRKETVNLKLIPELKRRGLTPRQP